MPSSHNIIDGCFHESQWGQLAAEREMWRSHMENTVETLDSLKTAINEIKMILQAQNTAQNTQSAEVTTIKNSLLTITSQMQEISRDGKDSIVRVHARVDVVEGKVEKHNESHCTGCKNEAKLFDYAEQCETVSTEVEKMQNELSNLYPMARGLKVVQDRAWPIFWTCAVILVLAAIFGVDGGEIIRAIARKVAGM